MRTTELIDSEDITFEENIKVLQFRDFANSIANKRIRQFAPPFQHYLDGKEDVYDFLQNLFVDYVNHVEELPDLLQANEIIINFINRFKEANGFPPCEAKFDILGHTKQICEAIIQSISKYFKGFPGEAYEVLENVFIEQNCHLMELLPQLQIGDGINMYRIRNGHFSDTKDMFHIPFQLRHQCSNYRFSINGTPSLYCGASIETCMLETKIRYGEEVSAALFRYLPESPYSETFIDLSLPFGRPMTFWEEYSLVIFYPLIVACGLKVKHPESPFVPEYIIPQLFYQVLRLHCNDNIIGISYLSSRYSAPDFSKYSQRNFVLFVRNTDSRSGYDEELAAKFKISGPIKFLWNGQPIAKQIEDTLSSIHLGKLNL